MRGRSVNNGGVRRTAHWEELMRLRDAQRDADDALHKELVVRLGKERYEAWARAHLSSLHEWRVAGRQLLSELILNEAQCELNVCEEPHA